MGSENPRLKDWYCGIINNEMRRKAEHNKKHLNISFWKCINAEQLLDANGVESYFSKKGTINRASKNGTNETSTFVYIFKLPVGGKAYGLGGPVISIDSLLASLFK